MPQQALGREHDQRLARAAAVAPAVHLAAQQVEVLRVKSRPYMTNLGSPLALAISPSTPSYVRFSLTMRNTCWMPSEVRLAIPPAGSNFGLLAARTSRLPAASCAGVGAGIRSSDPS